MPVPAQEGQWRILKVHTNTTPLAGADLENLVRRAGLLALRENLEADRVPMRLFEEGLREIRASVTPEMEYRLTFGAGR